MLELSNKSSM